MRQSWLICPKLILKNRCKKVKHDYKFWEKSCVDKQRMEEILMPMIIITECMENEIEKVGAFYDDVVEYLEAHINYPK